MNESKNVNRIKTHKNDYTIIYIKKRTQLLFIFYVQYISSSNSSSSNEVITTLWHALFPLKTVKLHGKVRQNISMKIIKKHLLVFVAY
jgi:hypothetical protein